MSKWKVKKMPPDCDAYDIVDDKENIVITFLKKDLADQVIMEHNAFDWLYHAAKQYWKVINEFGDDMVGLGFYLGMLEGEMKDEK